MFKLIGLTIFGFCILVPVIYYSFTSGEMWDEFLEFPWYVKGGIVFYIMVLFGGAKGIGGNS